jgi:hypothetical protein
LQKKAGRFDKFEAFPTPDSTQIPQLQKFAKDCTLGRRESTATELIDKVGDIYNEIKAFAENTNISHGISETQRVELLSTLHPQI